MLCDVFLVFYTQSLVLMLQYHIPKQTNILLFPCLYGMFFYVFVVLYTQSLVLKLQHHISTTKQFTVPLFTQYIMLCVLCVCCILHTITCTKVTTSHLNNKTIYRSLVYTVCSVLCSLYLTHTFLY